jgi:hypothetical protein
MKVAHSKTKVSNIFAFVMTRPPSCVVVRRNASIETVQPRAHTGFCAHCFTRGVLPHTMMENQHTGTTSTCAYKTYCMSTSLQLYNSNGKPPLCIYLNITKCLSVCQLVYILAILNKHSNHVTKDLWHDWLIQHLRFWH